MSKKLSFKVRDLEGPVSLYFNYPVEFKFFVRANGEVACTIPHLDLEVGGKSLEDAMDKTVKTVRAMTTAFRTAHVDKLSRAEAEQRLQFLRAVNIIRTFEMISSAIH